MAIVREADLSDFFPLILVGQKFVFVLRPMNIVTFLRKNDYSQRLLIFLWKETHSETKSWKSSRILRVNPCFFIFLSFFIIFLHFPSCSFMFFHVLSCSFMFFHVLSCSFMFFHVLSCSFMFFHFLSCSFMFFHVLSFSFMFFHCSFIPKLVVDFSF